jgi:hypothetical protein
MNRQHWLIDAICFGLGSQPQQPLLMALLKGSGPKRHPHPPKTIFAGDSIP